MPTSSDPSGKQDARLALLYLEAARRVIGPKRPGAMPDIEMMSSPVSFLIAHAVELALGAKLRSAGSRGGQGHHDLTGRLASMQKLGFVLPARFQSYVRGSRRVTTPINFGTPRATSTHLLTDGRRSRL